VYLTEKEIFGQYKALKETYQYFLDQKQVIQDFKNKTHFKSMTYIGCGSGYCLCQSGEISAKLRMGIPANSLASGDLMMNFPFYRELLADSLLVAPSRSGSTSEVILAVKKAKEELGLPCVSISAKTNSELSKIADLSLEIPWAFDESVCQTRTVTNLYTANLLLIAIMAGDQNLIDEIGKAVDAGDDYMEQYKSTLKAIGDNQSWEKVVVLADSELQGIANEGAIAFMEISQSHANYYHVLDVRHGPMVLVDPKTLVIMAGSPWGLNYQKELIADLKKQGAGIVVTVGTEAEGAVDSDHHITIPEYKNYGVRGIPFIYVPQGITFFRAISRGINPDVPRGLDPWIKL
jgi:glucosamine--fructose-6-phosphate aminotransferase (isomerizing)